MTVLAWLALAAAFALFPVPSLAGARAAAMARRGRLSAVVMPRWVPARSVPSAARTGPLATVACAAGAGVFGGVALALAAGVVAATLSAVVRSSLAQRRDTRRRRDRLAALQLLVAELEAGSRPDAALAAAAALAPDEAASLTAASAASGADIADVLACGSPELAPLAHAWRVAARTGAPLADVIGRVAADLALHDRQQQAVAVALAGPRSSAALLAGLPAAGIALGAAMGAHPVAVLLGTPGGRLLCCVGVVLDAAGVFWTQRLMLRAQRA